MADIDVLNRNGVRDKENDGPQVRDISDTAPDLNINISGNPLVEDAAPASFKDRLSKACWENEFVSLVIIAISIARAYPPLGADYVFPDITATWVAVMLIFILAGIGLKTEELSKSLQRVGFNFTVQSFNFFLVSSIVFGVTRALAEVGAVSQALADGMTICSCLPMTINMVFVLTSKSGGDEATAIFNAAFGNLIGVFLSPSLILGYLGESTDVELWDVLYKLSLRVLLPVVLGQLLQRCSAVSGFAKEHKFLLKQAQQYLLIYIIYTVFCTTFSDEDSALELSDVFITIAVQGCFMFAFHVMAWYTFKCLFTDEPTLRVMALYGSTHKSIATGIPLIKSIYENHPLAAVYVLPVLIWHPMQLVVGSFLSPQLEKWVEREQTRIATPQVTDGSDALPMVSVDQESHVLDSNSTGLEEMATTSNPP